MKAIFNKLFVLGLGLSIAACKGKSGGGSASDGGGQRPDPGSPAAAATDLRALLATLGSEVILEAYKDVFARTELLAATLDTYAGTLADEDRARAQAAFKDAILAWERAEVYQVGPAARVSSLTPGGKGLRNEIYSWPNQNACGVAALLIDADGSRSYADAAALGKQFQDVRGLDSLERLLFDDSDESGCAKATAVDPADWKALVDSGELPKRRASYARTVAVLVRERAGSLVDEFKLFLPAFSDAGGAGNKLFPKAHDGLNALTDAIFYLVEDTKDLKLGGPAGIPNECGTGCANLAELRFAKLSREAVVANLQAFIDLYRHGDDSAQSSLKGLLIAGSASTVAEQIDALADKALADAQAITPSLEEAAASGDPSLTKAFQSLQALGTVLKTDFLTTLSLALPASAAADND